MTKARAKEVARAAERAQRRGRSREEDVGEVSPPRTKKQLRNMRHRARYFAIKAAVLTPGIARSAVFGDKRVTYIVEDQLLREMDAVWRIPPYRPTNETLTHLSLTEAQIEAAFGPEP
ncbi:MAG: hypothetical protein IID45_11060 [Planctomycetes bacterium]|nr:hypothetical protein [Planctomycetota bacterium]